MLNMARADFYRLFRSKGLYITEVVLIFIVLISIFNKTVGLILGNSGSLSTFQAANNGHYWNAVHATNAMTSMTSLLIYIILPLFIMTIGFEFSRKIYKNPLSSGMTRLNYFISKYCVFIVITILQFTFYYAAIFLIAGFKNGFGHIDGHFFTKLFETVGIQILEVSAIFSIAVLALYLTFSTIASVITTIIFPVCISVLGAVFEKQHWLQNLNFQNRIDSAYYTNYSTAHLHTMLTYSFGFIFVCLLLAYLTFRKRDL